MTSLFLAVIFFFGLSLSEAIECPQVDCSNPCKSGLREDSNKCQTCDCVDPCEFPKCGPGEVCKKEVVKCQKEPCYPDYKCLNECPQVTCIAPCKSGYRNDSKGCQTCECVDPCEYPKCERGQTCVKEDVICKKEPCYPKYKCLKRCPLINCFVPCRSGYRNDSNGCQTCSCVDPCEYPKCKRGEICQVQIVQCFAPPCYPEYECIKECPKLKCHPCENGFIYHQNGCQTCECIDPKVNPCKSIRCGRNKICRAVVAPCLNPPCPVIGRCFNSKPM